MVEKQDAGKDQSSGRDAAPGAEDGVAVEQATEPAQTAPAAPANHRPKWKRRLAIGVVAALVLAGILEVRRPLDRIDSQHGLD